MGQAIKENSGYEGICLLKHQLSMTMYLFRIETNHDFTIQEYGRLEEMTDLV